MDIILDMAVASSTTIGNAASIVFIHLSLKLPTYGGLEYHPII